MRPSAGILASSTITVVFFVFAGCDLDLQPYVEPEDGGRSLEPFDAGGPKDASLGEGGGVRDAQPNPPLDAGDGGGNTGRKRVFVTSTVTTGALAAVGTAAIESANERCQALADAAKLNGKFVAWLSITGNSAFDRLEDSGPWYLVDQQTLVFANKDVLRTIGPNVPIARDETGKVVAAPVRVWTGTASNGQPTNINCQNFSSQNDRQTGLSGELDQTGSQWTQAGIELCNRPLRLYCFEQ
jgi:hypothetical protein